jgi:hypothetical protein
VLATEARGMHEHSATLGSGSTKKNYLMGFGRGYVLRKWSVLDAPSRIVPTLARDATLCAGQALIDRTISGVRGRLDGYAAVPATSRRPYPEGVLESRNDLAATLRRRLARRLRLHRRM